jgi:hypothetical protein
MFPCLIYVNLGRGRGGEGRGGERGEGEGRRNTFNDPINHSSKIFSLSAFHISRWDVVQKIFEI